MALDFERTRPPMTEPGYRLYAVATGGVVGQDLGNGSSTHLVIGRHTSCDVVLDDDPAISLRHVLVRTAVLDDGLPVLSLLDLESQTGFELSDGSRHRAVVVSGSAAFRIGATWFIAIPSGSSPPDELEPPLVMQSDAASYKVNPRLISPSPLAPPERSRVSRITAVRYSVHVAHWPSAPYGLPQAGLGECFELSMDTGTDQARVGFSERDVGHGILVGRSDRCVDAGLRFVLNVGISRVHALLIRERDGIWLYDLASLNGIFENDRRFRAIKLADEPGQESHVRLSGLTSVMLRWRVVRSSPARMEP